MRVFRIATALCLGCLPGCWAFGYYWRKRGESNRRRNFPTDSAETRFLNPTHETQQGFGLQK